MHDAEWFGVYGESAVHLPVMLPDGRPGTYSPFLVLGSDGAVAAGREHYGQPKKHGEVVLAPRGDLMVGTVARNGIEIATATICFKQQPAGADALDRLLPGSTLNVNLRVLPEEEGRFRRELVARSSRTSPCTRRGPVRRRSSSGRTRRRRSTCCPFDGSSSASTGWSI